MYNANIIEKIAEKLVRKFVFISEFRSGLQQMSNNAIFLKNAFTDSCILMFFTKILTIIQRLYDTQRQHRPESEARR